LDLRPRREQEYYEGQAETLTTVIRVFGTFVTLILSIGAMFGAMNTMTNFSSFSEVAFTFRITPALPAGGLVCAVLMGAAGGLLPALRAARIPIARALREI
jgi:putative ABC transport system permease protein